MFTTAVVDPYYFQYWGNFSIRFWRQYMPLFASIAAIIVPIVDFR